MLQQETTGLRVEEEALIFQSSSFDFDLLAK